MLPQPPPIQFLLFTATLVPLVATLITTASATDVDTTTGSTNTSLIEDAEPTDIKCEHTGDKQSFEVLCWRDAQLHLRLNTAADGNTLALIMWCGQNFVRDYQLLYSLGLRVGTFDNLVLHACLLPEGRLVDFFHRLGATGVRNVKIISSPVMNDTMPADFFDGVDNLTSLIVDGMGRIELHEDFLRSASQLEVLTITGTAVTLPAGLLRHTSRLRRLGLHNLSLSFLPTTILHGQHNLTALMLGKNRLTHITGEHLRNLSRLQILDLYNNQLETLPSDAFASLVSLQALRMHSNPLRSVPEPLFASSPQLKVIRMDGYIVGGHVPSLPARLFAGLNQLKTLMLDRLELQTLPAHIFSGLSALKNLTLDHNAFTTLPAGLFADLKSMQNLDLSSNQLHSVSESLLQGLEGLDTLRLNDNGLTTLPSDMFLDNVNLERLFLNDNNLTRIRHSMFSGLEGSLRMLQLANNSLEMDYNSGALQYLTLLRELHLQHNHISKIPDPIRVVLGALRKLDLRHNRLQALVLPFDLNFLCDSADIYMQHNQIATVTGLQPVMLSTKSPDKINRVHIGDNPFGCDCSLVMLRQYVDRSGEFASRNQGKRDFVLVTDDVHCASPSWLAGLPLAHVPIDNMTCPLSARVGKCPTHCTCVVNQLKLLVIATCSAVPDEPFPTLNHTKLRLSVRLQRVGLRHIPSLSNARLVNLDLSHNAIGQPRTASLPLSGLVELRLNNNNISRVDDDFIAYMERSSGNVTSRVWLAHNPLVCDCGLLSLHHFLLRTRSEGVNSVADASKLRCRGDGSPLLEMRAEQLCPPAHTSAMVAGWLSALVVMAFLLLACVVYYRKNDLIKVWLYSHGFCLWLITEEEMDVDKKYDAFISYSHLDEKFVVEHLVPELEQGEPKYTLCLHFRDWLAGEWITDQIQNSVQDSRRIIVLVSRNFIESEWGRLEFLAAHKQALNDKTNRVIVIVYGELPEPEAMGPELQLYISSNTYLQWGDARFWQRLRYALPHRGRRLKPARRRHVSEKLGLISRENGHWTVESAGKKAQPAPGSGCHDNGLDTGDSDNAGGGKTCEDMV